MEIRCRKKCRKGRKYWFIAQLDSIKARRLDIYYIHTPFLFKGKRTGNERQMNIFISSLLFDPSFLMMTAIKWPNKNEENRDNAYKGKGQNENISIYRMHML